MGETEDNFKAILPLFGQNDRIWVNSLLPHHNAHHEDNKVLDNPIVYDWYIENKVNMIQTDRPKELIHYLDKKGLFYTK